MTKAKVKTYPTVEHVQETTAFKKKKWALGAIETLMWLEDGAPHKFDGLKGTYRFGMGVFIQGNSCGTTCCIAGAIHSFGKKWNGDKERDLEGFDLDKIFGTISGVGRSKDLYELFYARKHELDLDKITGKQAAKTLRKYLEKGVVNWSHVK